MIAQDIYNDAIAHLNDLDGTLFGVNLVAPFIRIALRDMEAQCLANDIQLVNETYADQTISIGSTSFTMPSDLVVPVRMLERPFGDTIAEDFQLMTRVLHLPTETPNDKMRFWAFNKNVIEILGSTTKINLRLHYRGLIGNTVAGNDLTETIIPVQALTYLGYRSAALVAGRIAEDYERETALNQDADKAMELILATSVKDNQAFPTRRKRYGKKFIRRFRRFL